MKRRDFLVRSAGVALLALAPLGTAAVLRRPLLDDPLAWIGSRFRTGAGTVLELAGVEQLACDRHSTQLRLQFRTLSGTEPGEGIHALASTFSEESLFLQCGQRGPVACINRLHTLA